MENLISQQADYNEVMDFLNTFENVDDMLLEFLQDEKPDIKVISGDIETSYDYNQFIELFDTVGLDGLT